MSDRREKRPWYPRYAQDFIMGTMGMPLETRGAYSILLDLIYDRGGPIPDDPQWLAGLLGVSKRKWSTIRESLISEYGKITVKDGFISNARADAELIKSEKMSRKQSENGAKGGRTRAENQARSKENNDLNQATLKPTTTTTTIDSTNVESPPSSPPKGKATDLDFETFWSTYPSRDGSNPKKPARQKFDKAVASGTDPGDIILGARRYADACRANGNAGTKYTAQAVTWLNQERWQDDYSTHSNRNTGGSGFDDDKAEILRVSGFVEPGSSDFAGRGD